MKTRPSKTKVLILVLELNENLSPSPYLHQSIMYYLAVQKSLRVLKCRRVLSDRVLFTVLFRVLTDKARFRFLMIGASLMSSVIGSSSGSSVIGSSLGSSVFSFYGHQYRVLFRC